MNRYVKISAALAAFALLLVVMGLSTSNVVHAAPGDITVTPGYVCSLDKCAAPEATATNGFTVSIEGATDGSFVTDGTFTVTNLDVARVTGGINPRTITISGNPTELTVVQEFEDLLDAQSNATPDGLPDIATEIRGFNGNRIQIEYKAIDQNTFATFATVIVDNVQPSLITNSPSIPLIAKGNVDITFSADITDSGSGYSASVSGTGATEIDARTGTAGILPEENSTMAGGVRLVVAGNVVALDKSNFNEIDDGWNVWATINSGAIQTIGANTPWYFETRDRAGNTRRSGGSIELKGVTVVPDAATIRDVRFTSNLHAETFSGSFMKVTRGSKSVTFPIMVFAGLGDASGTFTLDGIPDGVSDGVPRTAANAFGVADDTADPPVLAMPITAKDKFVIVGTNLLTVDSVAPRHVSSTTGTVYQSTTPKGPVGGLKAKANSIHVLFDDDGKQAETATLSGDSAGSDLDASSVAPGAFTVSGNSVNSVFVSGNSVYLTLSDNLGPDEQPSVNIASGVIKDKAGNAFGGIRVSKAADGLGPNLSLSKSGDLSDERVTVTITTDEQLSRLPKVILSRVIDSAGGLASEGEEVCDLVGTPDVVELRAVPDVATGCNSLDVVEVVADPQNNVVAVTGVDYNQISHPGRPGGARNPSQTAAQAYNYVVTDSAVPDDGATGGKYNVYVTGTDTQGSRDEPNESDVGNKTGANNVGAFTFQLDTVLNGGVNPIVKVGEAVAEGGEGDVPEVEAIDNLIVTVDFAGETGEYPGDSYRTVDLTLAELTISFKDGTSEKTTFNLTTDVNSPDNIQFTVALLNPKVGTYSLKVKATDSAGNASGTAGHTSRWEVVSAKPVKINLQPGWNMISLPFQPGNPAINSVIPRNHPVDIVMTFDGPTQTWLVSRRDAETGNFVGDIAVMTASTAYFVRTTNFQELSILRPPIATNAAPPPQIPALAVVKGWNLIPIVSNASPLPKVIPADEYFGTLRSGDNPGWLKAITFNTLARSWEDVVPGQRVQVYNADGTAKLDGDSKPIFEPATVKRGKGYWLYATGDGVIIP